MRDLAILLGRPYTMGSVGGSQLDYFDIREILKALRGSYRPDEKKDGGKQL
jgi:hypothetical protein